VRLGMLLMEREEEMLVMAPIGNTANHVQDSTIHTGLDVAVRDRKQGASRRVKALWRNKIMVIIDEISLVSSKLMDSIDKQCKVVKNLDDSSTAVFGGLPVVIALGDFHQFLQCGPMHYGKNNKVIIRNEGSNYGTCSRM
jgi:hypothetical protein